MIYRYKLEALLKHDLLFQQGDKLEKSYYHKTLSLNSHIPHPLPLTLPYPNHYTSHTHHHLIRIFIFTLHKLVYILNQLINLTPKPTLVTQKNSMLKI